MTARFSFGGRSAAAAFAFALLCWAPAGAESDRADTPLLRLSTDRASAEIDLPIGQSRVFRTDTDVEQLIVGDPEIADVVLLSDRSFYILGRGFGQTNVTVFGSGDWPLGVLDVEVGVDIPDLRLALAQAAPEADLDLQTVNGRLRLAGEVPDAATLAQIMDIAQQYGGDRVINAMYVAEAQQVLLEVRFIEASRNAARDLGISVLTDVLSGDSTGRLETRPGLLGGALPFGSFIGQILTGGLQIDLLVEALESRGLARSLAEPNLSALSGETASFLAGGELPIPIDEEDGDITVEFKEFGVRLTFTPVVLGSGTIHLTLEPEVSQVDFSNAITAGGISLPAFTTRRARTTVQLSDGQSFAIAGLLQTTRNNRKEQVPYLGDIPVLGALFRSSSFQKRETDLVIIVTPHLARPAPEGMQLATPIDRTVPANDIELFLGGRQEVGVAELAIAEGAEIDGPHGHILDLSADSPRDFR